MMGDASSRPYIWLEELLEDPELLEMPTPVASRIVWPNRITLLAAREKAGKSTLAGAVAAAVSSGRNFLGEEVMPGNVLIVSLEEHPQEFAQRLVNFRCDPKRIAIVSPTGSNLIKDIRDACEEVQPVLIVWDTLGAFADHVSGSPIDPGNSSEWTRIMMEIVMISREYGASLLLHHSRKSDGKYRDSSAIGANVDMILEMFGEGDEPRTLKPKGRGSLSQGDFRLALEEDGFRLVESEAEFAERVFKFIASHPRCGLREIRDGVEGRASDIDRARDRLLKAGRILNVGNAAKHEYMARK